MYGRWLRQLEAVGCLLGVMLWAGSAHAQVVYEVGTFQANLSTGAQAVPHGLGVTPKVLLLWTESRSANGVTQANSGFSIGLADGTTAGQASVGAGSIEGPTVATSRCFHASVVCVVGGSQNVLADASLTSFSATHFNLLWNNNDGAVRLLHYLVLGGPGVSSRLVMWQSPGTKTDVPVTGFGFKPDFVLTLAAGSTTSSLPSVGLQAHMHFSVLTPTATWVMGGFSASTGTAHYLVPDVVSMSQGGSPYDVATLKSVDADGFTLTWTQVGNTPIFASLGVKGVPAKAGKFTSPAGSVPFTQNVTGVPFMSGAVLFGSVMDVTQTTSGAEMRFSFGAMDETHQASTAFRDIASPTPTSVFGIDWNTQVVAGPDGGVGATARGTIRDGGFSLDWSVLHSTGEEVDYLALGGVIRAPPDGGTSDGGSAPNDGGVSGTDGGRLPDGGDLPDGGELHAGNVHYAVGCGCGSASGPTFLLALALGVGLWALRRV